MITAGLEIRSAKQRDAEQLWKLIVSTFSVYEDQFVPSVLSKGKGDLVARCNSWSIGLVGGEIVAAVQHEVEQDIYTFSYLAVRSDMRRLGYGTQLYRYVEDCSRSKGRQIILVAVRRAIESNVKFVESLGFHFIGPFGSSGGHDIYGNEIGSAA